MQVNVNGINAQNQRIYQSKGEEGSSPQKQNMSDNINNKVKAQVQENKLSEEAIIKTIEHANKSLEGFNTSFEYSIHEETHQIMIKVLDKETNEVIREIPSEKILDMVAKICELAGIFVDEKR